MRLLDLFCGAGGCAKGYELAGFTDITGVDNSPQKRYPYKFIQADALEYARLHASEYDFIHASPPCQHYSSLKVLHKDVKHPDLIALTRQLISCKPYIIENVEGARKELIKPIMLCGSMFNLKSGENGLRRHRLFESSLHLTTLQCQHLKTRSVAVYGHSGGFSYRDKYRFTLQQWKESMGIFWMTGKELAQAIPPAYTEFLGKQVIPYLE